MVLVLFFAFLLFFGCTHERDNPYDPHGTNYNPSLFPSSSSSLSVLVPCMHTAGCAEISAEACFAFGGQRVAFCPAVSSSSLQAAVSSGSGGIYNSSSSSLPEVMVLCRLSDGTCPLALISQEACGIFGGTPVQSCVGSSSSSVAIAPSSSSVAPFSSSSITIVPSSSSVAPFSSSVTLSSSSVAIAPSSSSVAPFSSSAPPSSSSIAIVPSSSSVPTFACAMTATTGTVGVAISPAPAATCNGTAVTAGLTWTPANRTPTAEGSVSVSVSASSGVCSGRVAQCGSVTVSPPTFACNMAATTGTVGTAITPVPTVTCNGTAVTAGLTWTPANLTPTAAGSVSVSVSASSGVCSGIAAQCGSITVSAPTPTCVHTATTGTVGTAISAPTVTCNGVAVTTGLTWTPANLTPTAAGNFSVTVTVGSGACASTTARACTGTVTAVSAPFTYGSLPYEGQSYKTIKIGTQTWMAENLNYNAEYSKCHGGLDTNCVIYGRLYYWSAAMALPNGCRSSTCSNQINSPHRGICPSGWHIPSNEEWTTLTGYVGSPSGTKLKAASGWYDCGPSGSGSYYSCEDTFGFSALPGGDDNLAGVEVNGLWWSATELNANDAYYRFMYSSKDDMYYSSSHKSNMFSVRCLQD